MEKEREEIKNNGNDNVDVLVEVRKPMKTRLLVLFTVVALTIIGLGVRVFYITIVRGDDIRDQAFKQWFQIVNEYHLRGMIYDRNGNEMVANTSKTLLHVTNTGVLDDEAITLISLISGKSQMEIKDLKDNKDQIKIEVNSLDEKEILALLRYKGVSTIKEIERYSGDSYGSHIIGYINESDGKGISGVEKYYDEYLGKDSFKQVGAIMDSQRRILPGYGYVSLHKGSPDNIHLTLDKDVQVITENAMDRKKYKGSVVVMDAKSGEVLSIVSRPNFDQRDIASYIDSDKNELINKGIQMTYPPGSIFKIIVAAGLLEDNIMGMDDTFVCDGSVTINNTTIKCTAFESGGHGEINLRDGFSKSCNAFFIQGAQALGGDRLLELAQEFGIGEVTGIGLGEKKGRLSSHDYVKGAGIGNVAIGQGTLEVTPVQIARMTSIIANNGIDVGVRLVDKIEDVTDNKTMEIDHNKSRRVIKRTTANKISQMMKTTIEEGTGHRALIDGTDVFGKTGSAQAGVNGDKIYAWFSGFYLGEDSEYVITVVIEDENQGGGRIAAPVFADIANEMLSLGM